MSKLICRRQLLCGSLLWLALLGSATASAQEEAAPLTLPPHLTLTGFIDTYYAYDFNRPADNERPSFLYNHSRHNELSLNLVTLGLAYDDDHVRGALGLMAGTYSEYNYSAELDNLQSLLEAWAGLKLRSGLWLDAGLFASHIGFESARSADNPTLTRSLQAENSPYYLAGVRLSWQPSAKLTLAAVLANGWQNLRETPNNSSKGGGTQITWQPVDWLTLNFSSWISSETPDSAPRLRLFHDLYLLASLNSTLSLSAGLDLGAQQRGEDQEGWSSWYGMMLILHQQWASWLATAQRVEYYSDPDQVVVSFDDDPGLEVLGVSTNIDFTVHKRLMFRVEGRLLRDAHARFGAASAPKRSNMAITSSLSLGF